MPGGIATAKLKELKESFKVLDADHDGKLFFKEFFNLLRKGNPDFLERQAELLFHAADADLSGTVDFAEFVDFLFHNKEMERMLTNNIPEEEEEAKAALMQKSHGVRVSASTHAKARGINWRELSWVQRLEFVRKLEGEEAIGAAEPVSTKGGAEAKVSSGDADDKVEPAEPAKSAPRKVAAAEPDSAPAPAAEPELPPPAAKKPVTPQRLTAQPPQVASRSAPKPVSSGFAGGFGGTSKFPTIANMNQSQIVDYSIQSDDFTFVGDNRAAMQEMHEFKDFLRTASGPYDIVDIKKYIAKGTAGWVFQAEKKPSGGRAALKLIRMTQARTGMKEWYVSKLLRSAGVSNVVYTDETVRVLAKTEACSIVGEQLKTAGPVPYYICMMQEFLEGGTLEKLANEGLLSLAVTLRALEEVATALSMMHANQVQHRDVKPENVLLEMRDGEMVQAKVCDFGMAEIGTNRAGEADDIRRFGVTVYSVITGEWWTKNRLIHESHDNLVTRLREAIASSSSPVAKRLPDALERILGGSLQMSAIASLLSELREAA